MDLESYDKAYKSGDIVEIVSKEEYRARGGTCSDGCAIDRYAGSVCEVVSAPEHGDVVRLATIVLKENLPPDCYSRKIEGYIWHCRCVKRHIDEDSENAFDEVFV